MFACSICCEKPIQQCNSCNEKLLCQSCSFDHLKEHQKLNKFVNFGPPVIKLPLEKISSLKISVKELMSNIRKQKNAILKSASKSVYKIQEFVIDAYKQLDKMTSKYAKFLKISHFEEQDLEIIEELLSKNIRFDNPKFSKIK